MHITHFRGPRAAARLAAAGLLTSACHASQPAPPAAAPAPASSPATARAALPPELFPPGWRFAPGRAAVVAPHAMIASNSTLASEAGMEILKQGGNAVDAAVATGFALAVTYPAAGNVGGGGFMVIRMADGRVAALDYREMAPAAATRDMYLDAQGHLTRESLVGPLASGVPGSVAGMAEALRAYGTMPLARVMQPAIRLAAQGFIVDSAFYRSLVAGRALITRFAGGATFFPNGAPLAPGTRFVQPALARTLEQIAEHGPRAFYDGDVGDSLVAEMQRDGGIITKQDLEHYTPLWREPIRGSYRGDSIFAMPPSSSGGISTIESLNILETYPTLPPAGSAAYDHLLAEAFRRAFIDRNTELGDPAFVHMPVARLTSKAYARTLRDSIEVGHASRSPVFARGGPEPTHTTHYSVVDAQGNAVSTTTTINSLYGSGVYVRGAGFFLNNEMDDFASQPGKANQFGLVQGEANAIAPGKRMLSAMSPTIVVGRDGAPLLVAGAAGGPRIITTVTELILDVVDGHLSLADAMAAPRLHEQAWPDTLYYERGGLAPAVRDSLQAMGYALSATRSLSDANAVMRVDGGWAGVVEPRASGEAVGY